MEEKVFYQQQGVTVTQSRIILGSKTYAMSNISSVSVGITKPSRTAPIVLLIIGLFMLIASSTFVYGAVLCALTGIWLFLQKTKYYVSIRSNAGESRSLESKNKEQIEDIVKSINDAIVFRA